MPGYKRACRFCGQLVEANSAYCPFCRRAHPHQMVCPWCLAPIQADWQACNKCGKALAIPCAKCGNPVGPDADACATCGTVARYRCPTCAAVVAAKARQCDRCGFALKDYWKSLRM